MIEDLQHGSVPDPGPLRLRLQAAMVKKLAMMRLHREFQHNDSKINPLSEHMLWAALLVEDDEAVETLAAILITEAHERYEAKRGAMDGRQSPPEGAEVLRASVQRLLSLGSSRELNHILKHKVQKTSIFNKLPEILN